MYLQPISSLINLLYFFSRNAHTEICVLHDLLQMVREKRYLVLDPIQAPNHQPKLYIQFLSLKKVCLVSLLNSFY